MYYKLHGMKVPVEPFSLSLRWFSARTSVMLWVWLRKALVPPQRLPHQLSSQLICAYHLLLHGGGMEDVPRSCKNQMGRCTEVQVPVSFPSLVSLNPLMAMSQYSSISSPTLAQLRGCWKGVATEWTQAETGVIQKSFWGETTACQEGTSTFSEAKENFTCSCSFSLTLPLIPISVGARMRRGGKVLWLQSGWHGKDKKRGLQKAR